MDEPRKITFSIQEDPDIVEQLDRRADAEGTSRSALVRRAIRRMLFPLPAVPTFENCPEQQTN